MLKNAKNPATSVTVVTNGFDTRIEDASPAPRLRPRSAIVAQKPRLSLEPPISTLVRARPPNFIG
jgi:hypothetical protein